MARLAVFLAFAQYQYKIIMEDFHQLQKKNGAELFKLLVNFLEFYDSSWNNRLTSTLMVQKQW